MTIDRYWRVSRTPAGVAALLMLLGCPVSSPSDAGQSLSSRETAEVDGLLEDAVVRCLCAADAHLNFYEADPTKAPRQVDHVLREGAVAIENDPTLCDAVEGAGVEGQWASAACDLTEGDPSRVTQGYCEAELNYCVGQALAYRGASLASMPSTPEVGSAIVELAAKRMAQVAVGFAQTLGEHRLACETVETGGILPTATEAAERCSILQGTNTDYTLARVEAALRVAIDKAVEISAVATDMRARQALALGVSAAGTADDYAHARWGIEGPLLRGLESLAGPRSAGARPLVGPREAESFVYLPAAGVTSVDDVGGLVYVDREISVGGRRALQLLIAARTPWVPFDAALGGPDEGSVQVVPFEGTQADEQVAALVDAVALVHYANVYADGRTVAVAANGATPAHDRPVVAHLLQVIDGGLAIEAVRADPHVADVLPFARARLFGDNGLSAADFEEAWEVAQLMARRAQLSPVGFAPDADSGLLVGTGLDQTRLVVLPPQVRIHESSAQQLVFRLQDDGSRVNDLATDDFFEPMVEALGHFAPDSNAQPHWYERSGRIMENTGVMGLLQAARVHLARLQIVTSDQWPTGLLEPERTNEFLELIESAIGPAWSEYSYWRRDCTGSSAPFYDCGPAGLSTCTDSTINSDVVRGGEMFAGCPTDQRNEDPDGGLPFWSYFTRTPLPDQSCAVVSLSYWQAVRTVDELNRLQRSDPNKVPEDFCSFAKVEWNVVTMGASERHDGLRFGDWPTDNVFDGTVDASGGPIAASLIAFPRYHRVAYELPGVVKSHEGVAHIILPLDVNGETVWTLVDSIEPQRTGSVHVFGGQLADLANELMADEIFRPSEPANTPWNMPTDFIPPLENELSDDGNRYEDSYATYLGWARSAAENATRLLADARSAELSSRLDETADRLLLQEAALAASAELASYCGGESADDCSVARSSRLIGDIVIDGEVAVAAPDASLYDDLRAEVSSVDTDLYQVWRGFPATSIDGTSSEAAVLEFCGAMLAGYQGRFNPSGLVAGDLAEYTGHYMRLGLMCTKLTVLNTVRAVEFRDVPSLVFTNLEQGLEADYSEFGGAIRQQLIVTHQRILGIRETVRNFNRVYTVAHIRAGQVEQRLENMDESALCIAKRVFKYIGLAVALAASLVATVYSGGGAAATTVLIIAAIASTAANVTAEAYDDSQGGGRCAREERQQQNEARDALAQTALDVEELRRLVDQMVNLALAVATDDANLDSIETAARFEEARLQNREAIVESNNITDLPEWHILQTYQVGRAREQLAHAQSLAFIARRAIEYRFGIDLSREFEDEPFVGAPSGWANDVFNIETRSAGRPGTPGPIVAGEALLDYVSKLEDFVRGYPFQRRFRDSTDTQVIRLEELTNPSGSRPFHESLRYVCTDGTVEVVASVGELPGVAPCLGAGATVDYAELTFVLPADRTGYWRERLIGGGFNYRHESIAVNLVGTNVRDCESADNPRDCYDDRTLEFELRQDGEVYVENYEGDIRRYLPEPGVIGAGRALAQERVLTNPLSSVDLSYLRDFQRYELRGRPLSGTYRLRIFDSGDVDWTRLDGIQLLMGYRYWVRQR